MHFLQVVMSMVALYSGTSLAVPHGNLMTRQNRPDNHTLNRERADAVKASFQFAWDGYKKYAFPNDELHPVSNGFSNSRYAFRLRLGRLELTVDRNGWGASAVDAFSTALVMQIPDIVDTILEYIPMINFDETADQVSLFETTIRYLGGMLSGKPIARDRTSCLTHHRI